MRVKKIELKFYRPVKRMPDPDPKRQLLCIYGGRYKVMTLVETCYGLNWEGEDGHSHIMPDWWAYIEENTDGKKKGS